MRHRGTASSGEAVRFTFDGEAITARAGQSVAAALLAAGRRTLRRTRTAGAPRGLYCGIGACFDCLVDVDGVPAVRACREPVTEGARVTTSGSVGGVLPPPGAPRTAEEVAELAVLGAGPAGMAAALAAADAGCAVLLVDGNAAPGGQIHRQPGVPGAGTAPAGPHLPRRFHRVATHPLVTLRPGTVAWQAQGGADGLRFWLDGPGGGGTVLARAAVIATGAGELSLPFPGWDLPGVLTPGGAQALLKAHGVLAGARVLVAGTGPFLLPVGAALAAAGARVTVAEAAAPRPGRLAGLAAHPGKALEGARYLATLARHRARLRLGYRVAACTGSGRVERVRLVPARGGRRELTLDVDAVCVGFGFVPALEVPRALGCADRQHPRLPLSVVVVDGEQATSVPGVFAAGEATGVAGADVAELEGAVAGTAAARFLGRDAPEVPRRVRVRLRRGRRLAARLEALFPLGAGWQDLLTDDTVVCRCEDVTWAQVRDAIAAGAADVRAVKGVTRCGMGYCQGRTCGPALQLAVQALGGRTLDAGGDLHTRTVGTPVPLGTIAAGVPSGRVAGTAGEG